MQKKRSMFTLFSLLVVLAILLSACQPQVIEKTVEVEKVVEKTVEVEKVVEKTVVVDPNAEAKKFKFAVILPGVITDADYNTLGYLAMTAVQKDMGIESAYSEAVPVPDVERVMREYIDQGYNVIWAHGAQFKPKTIELAKQFPDLVFICEGDAPEKDPPANFWLIDRNFHLGYYAIGVIAGKLTKTGKVGYIAGATLPFSYTEVHAIQQAFADQKLTAELKPVWTGDFNDPTKARQVADTMIADKVDVIMGSLNLGMFGLFEAAKAVKGDNKVLITAKYTDKTSFAPDNYITSVLYDFAGPVKNMMKKIMAGEKGGYYPMQFNDGIDFQLPLKNVSPELNDEIKKIVDDIKSGKLEVKKDFTEIKTEK